MVICLYLEYRTKLNITSSEIYIEIISESIFSTASLSVDTFITKLQQRFAFKSIKLLTSRLLHIPILVRALTSYQITFQQETNGEELLNCKTKLIPEYSTLFPGVYSFYASNLNLKL